MVDIVTQENRSLYEDALDEMFRLRYQVAVNELGWPLPNAKDGYDIDEFDTDETIYLLEYAKDGRMVACARLNPTTRPTLLSELFPNYCDFGTIPNDETIYEYSRYMVTKQGLSQAEFIRARANITLAVNEFCLAYGIQQVTLLTYMKNYPIAAHIWETRPLGTPQIYAPDGTQYIAAISKLTEEGLTRSRQYAGTHEKVASMVVPLHCAKRLAKTREIKRAS